MGLTKYKLGELIELVQDTNSELQYGPDDVKGMTITKEVIPTKANVSEIDLYEAISNVSQQENTLTMAQQAFAKVNKSTLFDYL